MRSRSLLAAMVLAGVVDLGCGGGAGSTFDGASDAQVLAIKKLEGDTGHAWNVQYDVRLGTARLVQGRAEAVLAAAAMPSQATVHFLAKYREVFGIDDPSLELKSVKEGRDEYGWTHVRMQQHVNGIPVFNGELRSHFDGSGALVSVTSLYFAKLRSLDVNPTLGVNDALAKANAHWKANFQSEFDETSDLAAAPTVKLGINVDQAGRPALAYAVLSHIRATASHGPAKMVMMIDAKTGAVIEAYDGLETVAGSGIDEFGTTRSIEVSGSGSSFTAVDTTRPVNKITSNNANHTTGQGSVCSSMSATSGWDKSCVGAHYYAEVVYDYYKTMHARDSIDGKGLRMFNIVHYSNNYANAFWSGNGTNTMTYGDGDNSTLLNTTRGLDVIAHEMTHGVTEFESGLGYAKGTANGGMNESMSDIFGCLAEHWAQPNAVKNWQIGEDVAGPSLSGGALRFMDSPTKDGRSIDHASKNTSSTDVHLNSGVSNNAFYLMTAGGTNKTSSINVKTGIGWDKAGKVMYQTQTQYLMSSDGWAQFAAANLTAAKNIGLTQNEQNIIQCAWIAVGGLTTPTTCADTTGGDGVDGGTTMDSSTPPPTDGGTTTPDVRTDTPVPPADASADRPTVDTNVPDTPAQPDTVTPPVDAAPDVPTTMPDATGGRGGSSGTGGSGGGGTSGTGGSTGGSGGSTGGSGGSTGGTGGSTGGTAGGGAAGTTGGSTNRGGNGGSAGSGGSGPSDPGCGCTVPGQSAPSTKSTLALAVGLVAAAISRRRRRNAV